jgi:hypothetical protein
VQRALIEKLEKDNQFLTDELAVAEGSAVALKKNMERGRELEARIEGYQAEIDSEKQRCAELDKLILAVAPAHIQTNQTIFEEETRWARTRPAFLFLIFLIFAVVFCFLFFFVVFFLFWL